MVAELSRSAACSLAELPRSAGWHPILAELSRSAGWWWSFRALPPPTVLAELPRSAGWWRSFRALLPAAWLSFRAQPGGTRSWLSYRAQPGGGGAVALCRLPLAVLAELPRSAGWWRSFRALLPAAWLSFRAQPGGTRSWLSFRAQPGGGGAFALCRLPLSWLSYRAQPGGGAFVLCRLSPSWLSYRAWPGGTLPGGASALCCPAELPRSSGVNFSLLLLHSWRSFCALLPW